MQRKVVLEEQNLSTLPTELSSVAPAIRKGVKIASDTASTAAPKVQHAAKAMTDSSIGVHARSGSQYYDKWDKVAEAELLKLDLQDKDISDKTSANASTATCVSRGMDQLAPVMPMLVLLWKTVLHLGPCLVTWLINC